MVYRLCRVVQGLSAGTAEECPGSAGKPHQQQLSKLSGAGRGLGELRVRTRAGLG